MAADAVAGSQPGSPTEAVTTYRPGRIGALRRARAIPALPDQALALAPRVAKRTVHPGWTPRANMRGIEPAGTAFAWAIRSTGRAPSAAAGVLTVTPSDRAIGEPPADVPTTWIVCRPVAVSAGTTTLVVLVTSGFGAWRDREYAILANLSITVHRDQVAAVARNRVMADIARDLAHALHGSVQSRLLSCAMLLEGQGASHDAETLNAALREAIALLDDPLRPVGAGATVRDEVHRKVRLWAGFCEFDVTIASDAGNADGSMAGRVIEESITNAVRHGRATRIAIRIDHAPDGSLHVVVTDDGCGPQSGSPGIGSAYLRQVAGDRWSLTQQPCGAQLEAFLAPAAC